MSNKPSKIKINVTKILKQYLYRGENGVYLNAAVWPNKDGTGQYGDTHYIVQELPKEARDKGERGPIIGNLRLETEEGSASTRSKPKSKSTAPDPVKESMEDDGDSVPF